MHPGWALPTTATVAKSAMRLKAAIFKVNGKRSAVGTLMEFVTAVVLGYEGTREVLICKSFRVAPLIFPPAIVTS